MDEKNSKNIRICNRDSGGNDRSLFSNKNETINRHAVTLKKEHKEKRAVCTAHRKR